MDHQRQSDQPAMHSKSVTQLQHLSFATIRSRALCFVLYFHLVGLSAAGRSDSQELDFSTQVLPVLTKAGCNSGACHGAAVGQAGFKLSLLGYDPQADYLAITHELAGRRIDQIAPEKSLLLRKATRSIEHDGGRRIQKGSEAHQMLREWIAAGVPFGSRTLLVTNISVSPSELFQSDPGGSIQLRVTAFLSDGRQQDVTRWALYGSDDDLLAAVDGAGLVKILRRGLTTVTVRFMGQVAGLRTGAAFQASEVRDLSFAKNNFIDEQVARELKRLRLPPSPLCSDTAFLRRVYLDVLGRLPDTKEVEQFQRDSNGDKRAELIDSLLLQPEFADFWTLKLADWLLLNSRRIGEKPARAYYDWLHGQVTEKQGFDRMVYRLLTANGDTSENGQVNFYRLHTDPRDMGEFVSSALLGVRVACARCHNHPFDRWSQDDYHRFAAYFARVGFENGKLVTKEFGDVQHPKTKEVLSPRALGGVFGVDDRAPDRRVALAKWVTSPDNALFSKAVVNRIWKELMGRGLIEPVDDIRETNPASHPDLLRVLSGEFVQHHYDLRWLIRTVASSHTYQLSSAASELNAVDDRFFSHALLKPLSAQVLADAISQATGVPDSFSGYSEGTRAVQLIDAQTPSYTLDVFGRCPREASCQGTKQFGGGLSQSLHLINSTALQEKIRTCVRTLTNENSLPDRAIVEALYVRTLSRVPSEDEWKHWQGVMGATGRREEFFEDLLWALLNCREFAFNH